MPINYSRYPADWKTRIVPEVLKRANNCCEFCGLNNKQDVYAVSFEIKDNGRYKSRSVWFRVFEDAVRECGEAVAMETVRRITVVLTVAHLDHDEENHTVSLDRLRALCQACHCRYDAKEKLHRQIKKWRQL